MASVAGEISTINCLQQNTTPINFMRPRIFGSSKFCVSLRATKRIKLKYKFRDHTLATANRV